MKPSEFYQKYWKIEIPDGTIVSPPPLSEGQCFFMDEVCNNPNLAGMYYRRTRSRNGQVYIEQMKEDLQKLPDFLKIHPNPTT